MSGELFGAMCAADDDAADVLIAVAREFSPRITRVSAREVVMDLQGLTRLFGDRRAIAEELRRTAADRGVRVRVAIAGSLAAARLLARHRPGLTVVEPGADAEALAPLPVDALLVWRDDDPKGADLLGELVRTLRRWGMHTLAAFALLPPDDVAARLGQHGVRWQRVARGEDLGPLVPAAPEERFEQALDLEWPIEGLEPLSFVLGRLLDPLSVHLERRDRGAAILHVRLHLVTRIVHARSLQLPVPMRDAKALRTLLLLDLESHPPDAAIDRVVVAVDPTPGRVMQYSLLARPLPTPEQLSTLIARLQALMGDTRCGAPARVDSWQPGACAMKAFAPVEKGDQPRSRGDAERSSRNLRASVPPWPVSAPTPGPRTPDPGSPVPSLALRRFRPSVIVRVQEASGRPLRVLSDRRGMTGGRVETCAGPWRTSGGWWAERARETVVSHVSPERPIAREAEGNLAGESWDRDEWDVTLADRVTYRIFRERDSEKWFMEGTVD